MSMSINGQSQVPPGFRFHPTEEELLHYYLKKKVGYEKIDLDVIRDVDLNKLEPWDIQEKCRIGSTPQNDWYFFSHKDKKYPTGTRTNRATAAGFWKATGRDKIIYSNSKRIGMRKTLVFYKGRAPHGEKSDFIMHEYRLDDNSAATDNIVTNSMGEIVQEDAWVVCRVFKKKNHHKSLDSPSSASNSSVRNVTENQIPESSNGALGQIFQYMGRTCKAETNSYEPYRGFRPFDATTLPALESPSFLDQASSSQVSYHFADSETTAIAAATATAIDLNPVCQTVPGLGDWGTLDRLVASHLNGQTDTTSKPHVCFDDFCTSTHDHDIDLWNFNQSSSSSSDPIWHVSNASV